MTGFHQSIAKTLFASFLFASFLYVSFLNFAFAQDAGLIVSGTVSDKNGAGVAGAEVRLFDEKGKVVAALETDSQGEFGFVAPGFGKYILRVGKNGMTGVKKDLKISLGTNQNIEVTLEPRQIEERVTVTAAPDFVTGESVTAAKVPVALRDVPQSVEIVNQQLLESQNARSLQDALSNVTAVTVAQGEGRRDQFFIRGFSALGDQFVDGVRDDAAYYRDLANVERIEVVKGPAAVLFGRGSSGGLINRVTKRPVYEGRIGSVETTFGTYGLKRGTLDFGMPVLKKELAFRLIGAYEKSGGFRHFYFLDRYHVAPSAAWRPDAKTDVLFQLEYLADERRPDRGIPSYAGLPLDVPIETYYGYPSADRIENRVFSQAVRVERRLTAAWQIRNVFRHSAYDTEFYNSGPNGVCRFNPARGNCVNVALGAAAPANAELRVTRFQYNGDSEQSNYFNQTEAVGVFKFLNWRHTVLAGVELGRQNKRTLRNTNTTLAPVSPLDPILTAPTTTGAIQNYNDFDGKVFGVYLQDQINFTRRWKALVGARFDDFRQEFDDLRPVNQDLKRTDRRWSPRAGLVYQPSEWLSFYASYTRSFQPSGENLSLAANSAELEPEMTRNYETGIKAEIPQLRLNATLSVFRLDRDNIKTTDPQDPTRLLLVGEQRTDGIEATVSGSPVRNLQVYAGYAHLSAEIISSNNISAGVPLAGRRAGLVPRNSGNLWLTYVLRKRFTAGFGAFARGAMFTSANNLVTLPGYARFDASLYWRAAEHYEVGFNLKNLTNRRYYETSNGDNGILPGAPINGSLTLRYRW